MLNTLRHFREVPMKRVDSTEWVNNAEYTETLQANANEPCRL